MTLAHLLLSLLFLALVVLLVAGYVYAACFLARYVAQVVRGVKRLSFSRATFVPARGLWLPPRSAVVTGFLACLLLVASLYVYERNRWIRPESAWKPAKEYMAVGFVILDLRVWAARFVYPERAVCRPLVWLQRAVSRAGRRLIPETDGEHALWQYYFEVSPYATRTHDPRSEEILRLIATCEDVLESLPRKEMADPILREKNRYLVHTMTAFYYCWTYSSKYCVGRHSWRCSHYEYGFFEDRSQYDLLRRMVDDLVAAEAEWPKHPQVTEYVGAHPDFELIHIGTVILLLREVVEFQMQNIEFTCGDLHVEQFYRYSKRLLAKDSPYRRVNKQMRQSFRKAIVWHGPETRFVGHRLCGWEQLPSYDITSLQKLVYEPFAWDLAYIRLVKKLLPPERHKSEFEKRDQK